MLKRRLFILTFAFISLLMMNTVNTAEKEYNKVVSIVFDDSGSMAADIRWSHGNYALQTLVGLLNEGDILFINYMNASEKDIIWEVKKGDSLDQILAQIKDKSYPDLEGEGITPIESINYGINRLIPENNPYIKVNVVYENWLILITDGNEMTDAEKNGYVNYVKDDSFDSGFKWLGVLDRKIASIISNAPVDMNTVILKIGDPSQDMLITSSMVGSPLIYKSASVSEEDLKEKQILQNMIDISSLISGRLPVIIEGIDGNRLAINSSVPFNELDILMQNSNGNVQAIYNIEGESVDVMIESTSMSAPEARTIAGKSLETDSGLFGGAVQLTYDHEEALSPGRYILEFNTDISDAEFTIFCYPAIQFVFNYFVDSLPVEQVFQEEMVTLEFIPVRAGTDEVLTSLPSNIEYNLDMKNGDQFISFEEGSLRTNPFIIKDPLIQGSLTASIPEIWFWSLEVSEEIPLAPEEDRPEERIFELSATPTANSISYKNFDMAGSVYIVPTLNGERLTGEVFEKSTLSIMRILDEKGKITSLEYELVKEGSSWRFTPTYSGFKPNMPSGLFKFELRFSSEEYEDMNEYAFAEFTYEIGDASFVIRYFKYVLITVLSILVGIYLIGLVLKPRIRNKEYQIIIEHYDGILDMDAPIEVEAFSFKVNGLNRLLLPFIREKGKAAGLEFKAGGKKDHIYLKKSSQKLGMELGNLTIKAENIGQRDLRLNEGQKLEYVVDEKLRIYKYSKK